ncbi:MAG: oligosaccharide biosynthesis protein Alg14 [Chryseolinea sp.]
MKVLAIASAGGHWVQLLRLIPAFEEQSIIFVSTNKNFSESVAGHEFYCVPDGNRWNKVKLMYTGLCVALVIFKVWPTTIITTGAAPGLMGIIVGRLIGAKTIWIDSIANVERMSMSGRIALWVAHKCYTQWPHLANNKVIFNGNVL